MKKKNYSKKSIKKNKRKYSLNDRINYYFSVFSSSKNKKKSAFSLGYIDSATNQRISSDQFKTIEEKTAYHEGAERGHEALRKSFNLKW